MVRNEDAPNTCDLNDLNQKWCDAVMCTQTRHIYDPACGGFGRVKARGIVIKFIPLAELESGGKYEIHKLPTVPTEEIEAFANIDDSRLCVIIKELVDNDYCVVTMEKSKSETFYRALSVKVVGQSLDEARDVVWDVFNTKLPSEKHKKRLK